MAHDISPLEFKNLLIEFYSQHEKLLEDYFDTRLELMPMLGSENLSDGGLIYSRTALRNSLEHANHVTAREQLLKRTIDNHRGHFHTKLLDECRSLLDNELKVIAPELPEVTGRDLRRKAFEIAFWRAKGIVYSSRIATQAKSTKSATEFCVILHTLKNGHGGNGQTRDYFFDLDCPFQHFLKMLQDITKFSKIPPLDFSEKLTTREVRAKFSPQQENILAQNPAQNSPSLAGDTLDAELDSPDTLKASPASPDKLSFSTSLGHEEESPCTLIASPSSPGPTVALSSSPLPTSAIPHKYDEMGYTLKHGPWLWRFINEATAKNDVKDDKAAYKLLDSEDSYQEMMISIKKRKKEDLIVFMIHSMDQKAADQEKLLDEERSHAEAEFQDRYMDGEFTGDKQENLDNFLDDIGEPYMDWLRRNLHREAAEEEKRSRGQS